MKKIIVGIHGLKNKPPQEILQEWWKLSIKEGLLRMGKPVKSFQFELAYWADCNYQKPLDPLIKDKNSEYYIDNPYFPVNEHHQIPKKVKYKAKMLKFLEQELEKVVLHKKGFSGIDTILDLTIRRMFNDLDTYFHGNCRANPQIKAKTFIQERLAKILRENKDNRIMLIAHSMGSIVAVDTLRYFIPEVAITSFVTIGSPLGIPVLLKKMQLENGTSFLRTPENIRKSWFNFFDPEDAIPMHYLLSDKFRENSFGVKPIDIVVHNDYENDVERNPHKAYGYLRTPNMAKLIAEFLEK
ncbi:MAG: hypothetical protein DRZ79_03700 [Candidatus Cloacimonadota bacterium]|nr:MAG: hypothetical protein DRZ79_03700 [Candidatus Cloacimonadota bacterium]